ncbi:2-oxo-4-hydroxy-4-carboxy-5-ureidoimidazoline decarboxylase [Pseudohoeflea coraliihabitans]|uniref:2-oxo-4-hydroxy-4-carboxy-5-ureidoimidazoline decarboxylase n=1 Tax=Pseudohoeflea coraliihabitans TaxID=2860393 RepID=A0ABS6WM08_9HYPH|nr:2-oxo-4-hydroxy-4-carboxy-5-ureidoimidazoline decarboxylase [Pseudohoeflea sp. DP4N28-3]MBW3097001.1 2-oxo-4-hydroxy-4-carboxy-5-ureidoimidazoline decarboxylase [Pseudohoeflea sp. DP4N28-3]
MMTRDDFIRRFGGVFEHSPFIAERAWDQGLIDQPLQAEAVHKALCAVFRDADAEQRLKVLRAHPDLAGRLAMAGGLTEESKSEQAGAGLDRLTASEHARFTELNERYVTEFGFPFIIAVKGHDKHSILAEFERRITNPVDTEFAVACGEVEKIAGFRIFDLLAGQGASG